MTSKGSEKMTEITIGVDVSKTHLDAYRPDRDEARRFVNDAHGIAALIKWLKGASVARVVYEPTGSYTLRLERGLETAGLPLVKVNPRQARRFAEAAGKLAKTDRVDAIMLARMGEALELSSKPLPSRLIRDLKELHLARQALIKDRTAARNRDKVLTLPLLKRQNAQRLQQIYRQLAALDKTTEALIRADGDLARRFDILISIPGISKLTAFALLVDMPELGKLDAKQAASLAGLAPVARQSGAWKGRAFIRGGRAQLRKALYMPALVACRFNDDLKTVHARLIAAGKPAKVAITAVMRKLIVLANTLLRDGRHWTPNAP